MFSKICNNIASSTLKPQKQCVFEHKENENFTHQFFFFKPGLPASLESQVCAILYYS